MQTNLPHNGVATSVAAALAKKSTALTDEQFVETYIQSTGLVGSTADQAEEALAMSHQSLSARVNSLANKFRILLVGEIRPTRSGGMAQVYVHRSHLDPKTATALEGTMRGMEQMRLAKQLARLQGTQATPQGALTSTPATAGA